MLTTSVTLLERVRNRENRRDRERFIRLYTPLLIRWTQSAGVPNSDCEDVVQEIVLLLLEKLASFQLDHAKGQFRGWLRTVALNRCREWLRQRRGVNSRGEYEAPLVEDPTEAFWENEYRQPLIRRALEIMKTEFEERTWRACWEHVSSGRSAAEIAAELGMTEAAVYAAKSRVLKRLRIELQELLD